MAKSPRSKTRPGPGRPRVPELEGNILEVTLDLLAKVGYGGLTVDKIAAQARVSKSTIYRRWPSKEHLVIASFDQLPQLGNCDTGNLAEDLFCVLHQFVQIMASTPLGGALPAFIEERSRNPAFADALDPMIDSRRGPIKNILSKAIERGELPGGLDLDLAVDAIIGPVMLRLFFLQNTVDEDALRAFIRVVLPGLGVKT